MVSSYRRSIQAANDPIFDIFGRFSKLLPSYYKHCQVIDHFNSYIFGLIDTKLVKLQSQHNSSTLDENDDKLDVLDLMILAQLNSKDSFTREDLRANCLTFFLAGHDTTATALTFSIYLLGIYPELQDKARKEVISVMGEVQSGTNANDFPYPTNEELNQLKYLTCVIKETMRLYPSVLTSLTREVMSDYTFASTGQTVLKSTPLSLHIWNLHHSKEYWGDDVENFRPERWEYLYKDKYGNISFNPATHNYTWVPFGAGQRICIGQQIAIIEQRVILSMLLLRYTWKVVGDEDALNGHPKSGYGLVLRPSGIMLELTRRK